MINKIHSVTILGGGIMGSQIAFQAAYKGFDVTIYDVEEELYLKIIENLNQLQEIYVRELQSTKQEMEDTLNNISFHYDLKSAVENADLIIETIPEKLELKKDLFASLDLLAPEKTIFATNSSTLIPSELMESTGRPHKFIALHFANLIFRCNIAEIMRSPKTDDETYNTLIDFAKDLGMEPILVKKEQAGYVLNSLLIPLIGAAAELYMTGVADIESIDKTWKIATGSPVGPFEIYDIIGLNTSYNIAMNGDIKSQMFGYYIKENFIKKGKLGYLSGEGFYKYPKEDGGLM